MTYEEIREFLRIQHSCEISLSTLKRWIKRKGLRRRPLACIRSSMSVIADAVQEELDGSGANFGYRRMHRALLSKGTICRRNDVRLSLKQLDPDGVNLRKWRRLHRRKYVSPGPNFAWHIDGHDKLKPFGFSIHGGIDGFCRKLIWLTVSTTNKMPEVIAKNYLDAVIEHGGIPTKVKADNGTEHSIIEPIHLYFRSLDGTDEDDDFSIISSPQNQRIESYWSILGRDRIIKCVSFWI